MSKEDLGMTEEQWQTFQRLTHGFPHHDENGVDLSLLRENLKHAPLERLRKLEREVESLKRLSRAGSPGLRRASDPDEGASG